MFEELRFWVKSCTILCGLCKNKPNFALEFEKRVIIGVGFSSPQF